MTFVLLHEFGHQYYGHLNYIPTSDEAKKDECVVDEYAAEQLSSRFDDEIGQTLKCGIIVGLLSIILVDKSLKGDAEHPDSDERLKNIVEKLNLDELDNIYGIMSLALILWGNYYGKEISLPVVFDDYKSMYHHVLGEIKYSKFQD